MQDVGHGLSAPLLSFLGGDLRIVEESGDVVHSGASYAHVVDHADIPCFLFKDIKSSIAVRVAVWMCGTEVTGPFSGLEIHSHECPFSDLFGFQLGDSLHYIHDESAHGRRRIEFLLNGTELLALLAELIHHAGEIDAVPMDTIHLEDQQDVPGVGFGEHAFVFRAVRVASRESFFAISSRYLPAPHSAERFQAGHLRIE